MKKGWKVLLILTAVICIGVAVSYPIRYWMDDQHTEEVHDQLIAMRDAAMEDEQNQTGETNEPPDSPAQGAEAEASAAAQGAAKPEITGAPEAESELEGGAATAQAGEPAEAQAGEPAEAREGDADGARESAAATAQGSGAAAAPRASAPPGATPEPESTPVPEPTVNRYERVGALAYPNLEKRTLDEDKILPRYRSIYEMNHDLVGWIAIPGTDIDYPVVQSQNSEFYLTHDFFGRENNNGQIILDKLCDPYTPSYNLVISGHNMRSDKMFGTLDEYRNRSYWEAHKIVQFDTLMERKEYVVFAAFYSADYDEDETGFRYYTDIQYRIDADQWFEEIRKYQLYDSGIEVEFGDEFLTLTTCNRQKRQDGRFVVVCRKIRQGEEIT